MRVAKLIASVAVALLCAAPVVIGIGCGGSTVNMGDTHVGKEELYKTGNFDYDEFFEDVHGLQGSAKSIVGEEKAARAPLADALGVGETSIDRILEVLRDKAEEFAQSKNRVHFALEGVDDQGKPLAGKPIAITPSAGKGRQLPKEASDFAVALEQMVQKEGQVWEKFAPVPDRSKRLVEKADEMRSSLEKEFPALTRDKRDEIDREIKAAKAVSEQIGDLSDKVVANAVKFIKQSGDLLTAVANAEIKQEKTVKGGKSKGATPAAATTPPPPPKPKEAAGKPKEAPPKSGGEKPAVKVSEPKPAESGSDFNP